MVPRNGGRPRERTKYNGKKFKVPKSTISTIRTHKFISREIISENRYLRLCVRVRCLCFTLVVIENLNALEERRIFVKPGKFLSLCFFSKTDYKQTFTPHCVVYNNINDICAYQGPFKSNDT